jgi:hypothetical protein
MVRYRSFIRAMRKYATSSYYNTKVIKLGNKFKNPVMSIKFNNFLPIAALENIRQ